MARDGGGREAVAKRMLCEAVDASRLQATHTVPEAVLQRKLTDRCSEARVQHSTTTHKVGVECREQCK